MANLSWFQTMTSTPRPFPQLQLTDVQGNEVDIHNLVSRYNVILITLKSVQCPVCPQLLKILNLYGLDPNMDSYTDPFTSEHLEVDKVLQRYYRLVLKYDTYFIILCPGTDAEVRDVQLKTPFLDYPFISTYGGANELVKVLKVQLPNGEFLPAILQVNSNNLLVTTISVGRGPGQYFHKYLLEVLDVNRLRKEKDGIDCCRAIHHTMDQIKRRMIKCRDGKLGSSWISPSSSSLSPRSSPTTACNKPVTTSPEAEEENTTIPLPPEVTELIFGYLVDDIASLIAIASVCRSFYMTVCNVLLLCLRNEMDWLNSALPQNINAMSREPSIFHQGLDRWSVHEEGIPLSELTQHISYATSLMTNIQNWTKHWRLRIK